MSRGASTGLRLLWVTTKPPWPPIDGGRLVAARTIEALAEAGHAIEVIAPGLAPVAEAPPPVSATWVHARPRPWLASAARSLFDRRALSILRHDLPGVRAAVAARLRRGPRVDVVVAEQLQALAPCRPAREQRVPVVLRAQNVESALWDELARRRPAARPLLARETRRLRDAERAAVSTCAATLALCADDAATLAALAPEDAARVTHIPAPFPAELPQADGALPGDPALTLFAGGGWLPNASGAAWFLERVWPAVRAALPAAELHVFGRPSRPAGAGARLHLHAAAHDSRAAFAPGAVLLVPVQVASGVRLRILEAWARGVPVLATPAGAAGLEAHDGDQLLLARDPAGHVAALRELAGPGRAERLRDAGRALLRARHDPACVAARWTEALRAVRDRESG